MMVDERVPRSVTEALFGSALHEALEAQRERHVCGAWDKIMTGYRELQREKGREQAWAELSAFLEREDVKPISGPGRPKDHELANRLKVAWLAAPPRKIKVAIIDALIAGLGRDPKEKEISAARRKVEREITPSDRQMKRIVDVHVSLWNEVRRRARP
jgi:hypothetical protein